MAHPENLEGSRHDELKTSGATDCRHAAIDGDPKDEEGACRIISEAVAGLPP